MNKSMTGFSPNSNVQVLPVGELQQDGKLISGVVIGKNNKIQGHSYAYVLGSDNLLETKFLNGALPYQMPTAFVVGNGHKFGSGVYTFMVPTGPQIVISPSTAYQFTDGGAVGANIVIDAGIANATGRTKSMVGQNCVILSTAAGGSGGNTTGITCVNGTVSSTTGSGGTMMGFGATANGFYGMALGQTSGAGGQYSISMGPFSTANGISSVAVGASASTPATGQISFNKGAARAARGFVHQGTNTETTNWLPATAGSAQWGVYTLFAQTTNTTQTEMTAGTSTAATQRITLANDSVMYLKINIVSIVSGTSGTGAYMWSGEYVAKRGSSASVMSVTVIGSPNIYDPQGAGQAVAVSADVTNGAVAIKVTGVGTTTYNWHARVDTNEVNMTV